MATAGLLEKLLSSEGSCNFVMTNKIGFNHFAHVGKIVERGDLWKIFKRD